MIEAKIIADSISPADKRITTMQLVYPRFIHAEFMTHRVFSRNASSSRAIPVAKMIEQVRNNPAMPIHWGKNIPGMQAKEQIAGIDLEYVKSLWVQAANEAADTAQALQEIGLHKQVANRLLEPFQHIHVVVTATEWDNFFHLRDHEDAQPEIHELAIQMRKALDNSVPDRLTFGEWHLPYVSSEEIKEQKRNASFNDLMKISAARCARVSYLLHDGTKPSISKDLELYDRLVGGEPIHASPTEHQASPAFDNNYWSGNFNGWVQYRKQVEEQFK